VFLDASYLKPVVREWCPERRSFREVI